MSEMIGWHRVKRTSINMDFAESALSTAALLMKEFDDTPQLVICAQSGGTHAVGPCMRFDLPLILLPDAVMGSDNWAVIGERSMIWSPGA